MNQLGVPLQFDRQPNPGKDPLQILLVEDDQPVSAILEACLAAYHYQVSTASDGQVGLAMAQQFPYDLIVLDVILPGLDGLRFCQSLRSQGNQTPILLLTAKEEASDRVLGLNAGADDYMVKPFDLEELLARIRALLRRGRTADLGTDVLVWDNLRLDVISRTVWANQQPLTLTPKEYGLLELFLSLPNRVFSRSAILDRIWNPADAPGEETVSTHIKCLRQKLKAAGVADPIQTVHGVGYRLRPAASRALPAVEDVPSAAGSAAPSLPSCPPAQQNCTDRQKVSAITARVWRHSQAQFLLQVETVAQAVQALAQGQLTADLRQRGQQVAHKLAGSLGIFGLTAGSEAAHCLEVGLQQVEPELGQLSSQNPAHGLQVAQFQRWIQILLQSLLYEHSSTSPATELALWRQSSSVATVLPLVRVVSPDRRLVEQLTAAALSWGLRLEVSEAEGEPELAASELAGLAGKPGGLSPQALLLDLDHLNWQESLRIAQAIPTVMLTSHDRLPERLAVTDSGGLYLQKPLLVAEILQALTQILRPQPPIANRILVVDDDQTVLHWLDAMLRPWDVQVFGISDVQQVWSRLQMTLPNLLILDGEMPDFSGCQICRMVKHDPQWRNLPILFLSKHGDPHSVERAFRAGADDYLCKTHPAPALVEQILTRLKRFGLRPRPVQAVDAQAVDAQAANLKPLALPDPTVWSRGAVEEAE
jgi:DNA-binding response OmpR family regulator/HPt (histidine-containing phosphotransfer) domain-containing protein